MAIIKPRPLNKEDKKNAKNCPYLLYCRHFIISNLLLYFLVRYKAIHHCKI